MQGSLKVLLIGNSDKVLENKFGDKIDSTFDCVVRFNNFVIEKYEEFVGTKTTHISLSPSFMHRFVTIPDDVEIFLVAGMRSKHKPSIRNHHRYKQQKYIGLCDTFIKINESKSKWSSGVIVANYFLKHNHKVYRYGICDGGESHYFDLKFKVDAKHSLKEDLKQFNEWRLPLWNGESL